MTSLSKDKQRRLFSGIEIPENIKSELTLLSTGITERANLRFVPPENMHITLQFYGNVPEEDIPDLKRHLEQASANTKPFELPFSKLLCFPEKKPRMIWALFKPAAEFDELFAATHHGDEVAKTPLPHITLARYRKGLRRCIDLPELYIYKCYKVPVTQICLWESITKPEGAVYCMLSSFKLGISQEK